MIEAAPNAGATILYAIYGIGAIVFVWIVMQLRVYAAKRDRQIEERYYRRE